MKKVHFILTDAGGGRRAAANALQAIIEEKRFPWRIKIVNIYQEVVYPCNWSYKWFRFRAEEFYNRCVLGKGLHFFYYPLVWLLKFSMFVNQKKCLKLLEEYWGTEKPDMVVSFLPFFNKFVGESLPKKIPFVVILTDLQEWMDECWFQYSSAYHICGTEKAIEQARKFSIPDENILKTSGLLIHPRFYAKTAIDVAQERINLGLDPNRPTGLVMFGAYGTNDMLKILDAAAHATTPFQLIFICGRNVELMKALKAAKKTVPVFIEGFTDDLPFYMQISDFFIGKPGSISINEAVFMGLPILTTDKTVSLKREQAVASWIVEKNIGICVKSFGRIGEALQTLLNNFAFYKSHVLNYQNKAIFEVPDLLAAVLSKQTAVEK